MILIILIGIIDGVLSYWFNTSDNESRVLGIPSFIFVLMLMGSGAFLGSLILTLILNEKPWKIALLITAGVIIGIMCRIVFDVVNDLSTHNLFPIEIIMALVIIVPSAFIGSYLSQLFKNIKIKITSANNV